MSNSQETNNIVDKSNGCSNIVVCGSGAVWNKQNFSNIFVLNGNTPLFLTPRGPTLSLLDINYDSGQVIEPVQTKPNLSNSPRVKILSGRDIQESTINTNFLAEYDIPEIKLKNVPAEKYVHISDRYMPPRAIAVLPAVLQLRQSSVSPRRSLPTCVRFGPVQGVSTEISTSQADNLTSKAMSLKMPIFYVKKHTNFVTYIDVSDKDKSNWFSLLPLGSQLTANVWLYEENDELHAITTKSIPSRTPLALGYSRKYAEKHGLINGQPVLDLNEESPLNKKEFWCHECQRSMFSAALLQHHIDEVHKEDIKRRRYRCKHCTRMFARLYTLKRHIARYCVKRSEKCEPPIHEQQQGMTESAQISFDTDLNSSRNIDDNKLPSDESLQNLTNSFDFTNLFDTDKIHNFDISVESNKSDLEFNSYNVGYRDGDLSNVDSLSLDIGKTPNFGIISDEPNAASKSSSSPCNKKKSSDTEKILVSCSYCNNSIEKRLTRRHARMCSGRKLKCECGRVFSNKDKLALHIYSDHAEAKKSDETEKKSESEFICAECKLVFKRRGMLVNHLWRVHGSAAGSVVPHNRRVRLYPCFACTKLYRSNAKRERHERIHHPDAVKQRDDSGGGGGVPRSIVSGTRPVAAAECVACPRQYASRAKLLQHMRQNHPHLAPPLKKSNSKILRDK